MKSEPTNLSDCNFKTHTPMKKIVKLLAVLLSVIALETSLGAANILAYQSSPTSDITRGQLVYIDDNSPFFFDTGGGQEYFRLIVHNHFLPAEIRGKIENHIFSFGKEANDALPGPFRSGETYFNTALEVSPQMDIRNNLFPSYNGELTEGFFKLHEYTFSESAVQSLAVDFTQHERGQPEKWIVGSIRYNSDVPLPANIPEPATAMLLALGVIAISRRLR